MDLSNVSKEELKINNYYYDKIDNISEQIISQYVTLDKKLNKNDFFNSEKLFMAGLNKLMKESDYDTGYSLVKAFADWTFNINAKNVNEYRPGSNFFNFSKKIIQIGKEVDFNTGNNFRELFNVTPTSVDFIQKSYFSRLSVFDSYVSGQKSQIAVNTVKNRCFNTEKYAEINNPNQFLSKIVENKDVRVFGYLINALNELYDENGMSICVPGESTLAQINIMAKDADYGNYLASQDYEDVLPLGQTQKKIPEMFAIYQALINDEIVVKEQQKNNLEKIYNFYLNLQLN